MKTQVNKSQAMKEQTNRVAFFSILFVNVVILFTATANNYGQSTFLNRTANSAEYLNPDNGHTKVTGLATEKSDDTSEDNNLKYISPLEACCSNQVKQELEVEKMNRNVEANEMAKYWNILAEFNDIKEDVFDDEVVSYPCKPEFPIINFSWYDKELTEEVRNNLKELYEQKNREIFNEIEMERKFRNSLEVETEDALEVEEWMLDETNFGTFLHIEEATEEVLEIEDWMYDENVFSPNPVMEEFDAPLELEKWMTAESVWN